MAVPRRGEIVDALRQRIVRGLRSGALAPGDRLPSTREVAQDLAADPRVAAAAYRVLEAEGLVELRPRAGVFVKEADDRTARRPAPTSSWAADALTTAVTHGVPLRQAASRLRALSSTDGIRAVVAAGMADQVDGLARELREDYGLETRGVIVEAFSRIDRWPRALERAHLVFTTEAHAQRLKRFHREGRPLVIACVRNDLMSPEWRLLARGVVYVVVADPRFAAVVRQFLAQLDAPHDVRIRVAGRDRLDEIPPDAPTYITEAARNALGRTRLPGTLIPPARILDASCSRAIVEFIVAFNAARSAGGHA